MTRPEPDSQILVTLAKAEMTMAMAETAARVVMEEATTAMGVNSATEVVVTAKAATVGRRCEGDPGMDVVRKAAGTAAGKRSQLHHKQLLHGLRMR